MFTLLGFRKSTRKNKKYTAVLQNENNKQKLVHFGQLPYQHYYDKIGLYSDLNHLDEERRRKYQQRFGRLPLKKYTPHWFSWNYLW